MKEEYLRIDNGVKILEGKQQLYGIFLQIYQREICGIVSGNMSDTSRLVAILIGRDEFTYGHIYYKGNLIRTNRGLIPKGKIAVIDNQFHLVDNLSLAENIYIVNGGVKGFVSKKALNRQLKDLFLFFQINIPLDQPVKYLNNLERCQLELLKAHVEGVECVIIDHRFHYFIGDEFEQLYALVNKLKARGMTFIMIDYVVPQVMRFADSLAVLHRGKITGILNREEFDEKDILKRLTGGRHDSFGRGKSVGRQHDECALELDNFSSMYLDRVNLQVKKGEIVTIICEERRGSDELCEILRGRQKKYQGEIRIANRIYRARGYHNALEQGICFVENNPADNNLFYNMDVYENVCISKGERVKALWRKNRYRENMQTYIAEVFGRDISKVSLNNLSDEELQKIVFYRAMVYRPDVIVCINPFSTADIHMSMVTEEIIKKYAQLGIGILVLSQNEMVASISTSVYRLKNKKIEPRKN